MPRYYDSYDGLMGFYACETLWWYELDRRLGWKVTSLLHLGSYGRNLIQAVEHGISSDVSAWGWRTQNS